MADVFLVFPETMQNLDPVVNFRPAIIIKSKIYYRVDKFRGYVLILSDLKN